MAIVRVRSLRGFFLKKRIIEVLSKELIKCKYTHHECCYGTGTPEPEEVSNKIYPLISRINVEKSLISLINYDDEVSYNQLDGCCSDENTGTSTSTSTSGDWCL